ncbi:MAG: HAD family phosphatase [Candidatus Saccharibacteria bacterium]|nr:HAD family phosphatase [Pseudorhodobacter sp.]
MTKVGAVIFDCDGVVMDSEGLSFDLLSQQLTQYDHPMKQDQMRALFLGGTMRSFWTEARALGVALPDDWVDAQYARMYAALAEHTPLIEGILDVLDALDAAGVPYAMGSNGPPRKMEITMGQYPGLTERFGGRIYSAQALGAPKPAPDVYLHAAKVLGVPAQDCVVVEDSVSGAKAARAAGMRCMGFAEHGPGDDLTAVGAEVFHRMADLPGMLGLQTRLT